MIHDMWHVKCDTRLVVMIVLKFQVPSSNGLGVMVFEDLEEKDEWINELVNEWQRCL